MQELQFKKDNNTEIQREYYKLKKEEIAKLFVVLASYS